MFCPRVWDTNPVEQERWNMLMSQDQDPCCDPEGPFSLVELLCPTEDAGLDRLIGDCTVSERFEPLESATKRPCCEHRMKGILPADPGERQKRVPQM